MKLADLAATTKFLTMASACIVVAALYFAQDVLIPLALAGLLSYMLTPVVEWAERLRIGRSAAVVLTMLATCAVVVGGGMVATQQIGDLASNASEYQKNLETRLKAARESTSGFRTKFVQIANRLRAEPDERPTSAPDTAPASPGEPVADEPAPPPPPPGQSEATPVWTRIVEPPPSPLALLADTALPLMGPFGTAGLVLVLSIFMLIYSEDLRDRIVRLAGEENLHITTKAIDEASIKVSKYLSVQLIINSLYGLPIGVGLFFLGIPNAALWGILATVLRFIPYIGAWIAAGFPILLSLAISTTWMLPIEVVSLFIVMELISNNLIEPYLYGKHTGVSALAVIVSAVFWTWLWGPVGLFLSTPLTVCAVVMSRYIPSLQYIYVLFGDAEALLPHLRIYQRLLAGDVAEARQLTSALKATNSALTVAENNIFPVLHLAERDSHGGRIDAGTLKLVQDGLRDISVNALPEESEILTASKLGEGQVQILCIPARDPSDAIAASVLEPFLLSKGYASRRSVHTSLVSELIAEIKQIGAHIIVISAVPPKTHGHIAYISKKIWQHYPDIEIFVALWNGSPEEEEELFRRMPEIDSRHCATTLTEVLEEIRQIAEEIVVPAQVA